MLYLMGSIVLTSYLTLCFKVVEKYDIPAFQAILFNYLTCIITGSIVNASFPINTLFFSQKWFPYALLMGVMFISIFNVVGFVTQKMGVAVASVANKLSMVIPFLFSLYLYGERFTYFKMAGVLLALLAVILTCFPAGSEAGTQDKPRHSALFLILVPAMLFISSGLLDTLIKFVEQHFLNGANNNDFLIGSFAVAGTVGLVILLFLVIIGRQKFNARSIPAGIAIGVPNYFSIWCLVKVLKEHRGNSSAIIPVNNMGIVLFSALAGWVFFQEKLSLLNWMGIILSIGAIALIAFA